MGVERLLAARTDVLLFESVFIANRFHQRIGDAGGDGADRPERHRNGGVRSGDPSGCGRGGLPLRRRAALGQGAIDTLIDGASPSCSAGSGGPRQSQPRRHRSGPAAARGACPFARRGPGPSISSASCRRGAPSRWAAPLVVPSRAESLPPTSSSRPRARRCRWWRRTSGGIGEVFGPYPRPAHRLRRSHRAGQGARAHGRGPTRGRSRPRRRTLAAYVSSRFSIDLMASSVIAGYHDAFARRARPARPRSRDPSPFTPESSRECPHGRVLRPGSAYDRRRPLRPRRPRQPPRPGAEQARRHDDAPQRAPSHLGDHPGRPRAHGRTGDRRRRRARHLRRHDRAEGRRGEPRRFSPCRSSRCSSSS